MQLPAIVGEPWTSNLKATTFWQQRRWTEDWNARDNLCVCILPHTEHLSEILQCAIPEYLFSIFHTKNKEHGNYCNLSFFLVVLVMVLKNVFKLRKQHWQRNPANGLAKDIISLVRNNLSGNCASVGCWESGLGGDQPLLKTANSSLQKNHIFMSIISYSVLTNFPSGARITPLTRE